MRTRLAPVFVAAALSFLALGLSASAAMASFGLNGFDVRFENEGGSAASKAGSHPFAMTTVLHVNYSEPGGVPTPDGELKDLTVNLPVGFAGNPTAMPTCSRVEFFAIDPATGASACPDDTAVGEVVAEIITPGSKGGGFAPVFNLQRPPGTAAELGFIIAREPVTIDVGVKQKPPYNVSAAIVNTPQLVKFFGSDLTVWGNPANPAHDSERGSCLFTKELCPVGPEVKEKPFLTLPRACAPPVKASYSASSWQEPADAVSGASETALELSECEELGFGPSVDAQPTTGASESPSGLDFNLDVDDPGLTEPQGTADSDIKKTVVTLPAGITTNPAVASGLEACALAQYEAQGLNGTGGCPEGSKLGEVEVETPLLEETILHGSIYVAKQHDNPFDNLLTILIAIEDPELGILVKLAGKVEPDPQTGQLTTTFDEIPQLPFSHFRFHFREGNRAPLITPPTCGDYSAQADLYPYSKPDTPLHESATFTIGSGANGALCSTDKAQLPHKPAFSAGTLDPTAAAYSPFVLRLSREDGSQQLSAVSTTLPGGLLGKLAGLTRCTETGIAKAQSRSGEGQGAAELADPSCPASSQVGAVTVGAGAGPEPFYVQGNAYLAGPYKGAPLSLEIITPAVAGPFDLGVVTVRTALQVNPETTQITATSDPIPQILHGLPLDVRKVAVEMSRHDFTLNPTSCEPKSITGSAISALGTSAPLSQYFQASDCARLGFKPKLALKLKGGTKRAAHPALTATVTYPKGGAYSNVAWASVALPHSEFLDQGNIQTICTRVQFAADQCPKGSVYGKVSATSPLFDETFSGPIYLRSSSHNLPDLVAALKGPPSLPAEVDLIGRIDSIHGGIRTRFEFVPDVPVSKAVFSFRGAKKGLLENSTDLCLGTHRATARFGAQSGKRVGARPELQIRCPKARRRTS